MKTIRNLMLTVLFVSTSAFSMDTINKSESGNSELLIPKTEFQSTSTRIKKLFISPLNNYENANALVYTFGENEFGESNVTVNFVKCSKVDEISLICQLRSETPGDIVYSPRTLEIYSSGLARLEVANGSTFDLKPVKY